MNFKLIFGHKNEVKNLKNEETSIKDILNEMDLSSETVVAKKMEILL